MDQYKQGVFFSHDFVGSNSWNGYENNCLFANVGDGQFIDIARPSGADGIRDGRGVATADFDGDGRLDVVINNNNNRPTLYMNRLASAGNWLGLALVGSTSNRDAVGAKVQVTFEVDKAGSDGRKTLTRWVEAGSGYASQSALSLHFGLGEAERIEGIDITWPSGDVARIEGDGLAVNQTLHIEQSVNGAVVTETVVAGTVAAESAVAASIVSGPVPRAEG